MVEVPAALPSLAGRKRGRRGHASLLRADRRVAPLAARRETSHQADDGDTALLDDGLGKRRGTGRRTGLREKTGLRFYGSTCPGNGAPQSCVRKSEPDCSTGVEPTAIRGYGNHSHNFCRKNKISNLRAEHNWRRRPSVLKARDAPTPQHRSGYFCFQISSEFLISSVSRVGLSSQMRGQSAGKYFRISV